MWNYSKILTQLSYQLNIKLTQEVNLLANDAI